MRFVRFLPSVFAVRRRHCLGQLHCGFGDVVRFSRDIDIIRYQPVVDGRTRRAAT